MTPKTLAPSKKGAKKSRSAPARKAPAPAKIDLRKEYKAAYHATAKKVDIVDVPAMKFLMIDGTGDPNTSHAFQEAVQALYSVSYTLKFMMKLEGGTDWAVMPLEGLWSCPGGAPLDLGHADKSSWEWTLMVAQPNEVTPQWFEAARKAVVEKKGIPAAARARLETFKEGRSAQVLHVGPYATEGPTIQRMHQAIAVAGGYPTGRHHEIYLGDPRRTAPEKLKTIVRQPFA